MGVNLYGTESGRRRLAALRVGIAGAGGLGSNCAMHLVRAGVGHLAIADFDVVTESNLNRQFFFRDQIGRPKVEALAENLRRIDPGVDLNTYPVRVTPDNFALLFAGCDIVVEAFDDEAAKRMFLVEAPRLGKPMVVASGIAGWGRSDSVRLKRMGQHLVVVGDGVSAVSPTMPPVSPRVGIAAAMQANAVCAMALGIEP